jgi:hypothetical protein
MLLVALGLTIATLVGLLLFPSTPSNLGLRCYFKEFTTIPCAMCGITRWHKLIGSGDLSAALAFQPFYFLVVGWLYYAPIRLLICGLRQRPMFLKNWEVLIFFATLALSLLWNILRSM